MMRYQIHWKHEENAHYKTASLPFERDACVSPHSDVINFLKKKAEWSIPEKLILPQSPSVPAKAKGERDQAVDVATNSPPLEVKTLGCGRHHHLGGVCEREVVSRRRLSTSEIPSLVHHGPGLMLEKETLEALWNTNPSGSYPVTLRKKACSGGMNAVMFHRL